MIPRTIIAYHGCDTDLAMAVISGKRELPGSANRYDWLGKGIYFWEDSYARAWQWAEDRCRRRGKGTPAVVGAIIYAENCLNLIDPASVLVVKSAYQAYLDICMQSGKPPATNQGLAHDLDCEVFNTLHNIREAEGLPAFDVIRAFFTEGQPIYRNAELREKDHIQIVVRNTERIAGYFLPKPVVFR